MSPFRGSDDRLDREIATLEGIARLRLRRAARDFADLERELHGLRRERARRQAASAVPVDAAEPTEARAAGVDA